MSDLCTVKKSTLDGIAEAIQSKTGESGGMLPSEMKGKIEALPSQPAKGLVFSEYDSDGYPHKAEFVGSWTEIPINYYRSIALNNLNCFYKIHEITIPEGVTKLNVCCFSGSCQLTKIYFPSTLTTIDNGALGVLNGLVLYDFSHATSVPSLYNVNSLGHANGCVIKVPSALLTDWQSATNWSALTNVTWQGV